MVISDLRKINNDFKVIRNEETVRYGIIINDEFHIVS